MHREGYLTNTDASNHQHLAQTQSLTRKTIDHHTHHHSIQSPPTITTTDYSDPALLPVMRVSNSLFDRRGSDVGYDTDGGIGTTSSRSKFPHLKSHNYDHFVSPRLPPRRSLKQPTRQSPSILLQQQSSAYTHLAVNAAQHHEDHVEEPIHDGNTFRRHIRLSRHIRPRSPSKTTHESPTNHSSTIPRHDAALATTISGRPFRLIFMRHSERVNQVLGASWFSRAFRTNTYQAYDPNLPTALPKRNSDLAYEFDAPITVNGLRTARHTGRAMINANLIADVCLSSTALRCIQTAERILTGMDRIDQVSIRIEPGLFECPHLNYKIVDSFMTKKELVDNGYQIKLEYKSLIPKINVPETLNEYFDRCVTVMRGIIDRYGHHGGTVLVITHAPGLLALTEAIKGKRPDHDTFYRTVAKYPPLATYIAEYDGTKWKHSEQPFSITPLAK